MEWTTTFGQPRTPELARTVQQTSDGGYILVGGATPSASRGSDVYLIKTDASGNLEWAKTFGGEKDDSGFSVQQTADGGYIVVGEVGGTRKGEEEEIDNGDVYLIKTDAAGNVQWEKRFGGAKSDRGEDVRQTLDGGYIIVGMTMSFGAGQQDIYLVKTDASGNKVWEKTFGKERMDFGYAVRPTTDGGYIVAGITTVGFGRISPKGQHTQITNAYLIKTDSAGNLIWEKTFGGEGDVRGLDVKEDRDGNYVVTGTIDPTVENKNDCYLLKVDRSGKALWEKSLGREDRREWCFVMDVTSDGGYVLAGETHIGPLGAESDLNVYVIRTDVHGNLLWTKEIIGGTGAHINDWVRGAQQTKDGGYILAGMKTSPDGNKDVFLIKLAPDK